ncbi:class I SAM-dependent methyltransferase [Mucilaginibacter sp.]|uniref:class I SAM-dependent methyltransferase n=1 Tax=Mucilaginibacter sp. TaxID=1882438 RepID=UPI003D0AFA9B
MIRRAYRKLKKILEKKTDRFDGTGERVDIFFADEIDYEKLDMYQKSHYKRYEYALKKIKPDDTCGDFACGTGYGSIMLSKKAKKIIGADINTEVVQAIKKRYKKNKNVDFINANLLDLTFNSEFENIISFETIEHFKEVDIRKLLLIFNKALKPGGKLIISTPYMQKDDEAAIKLGHHLTFFINEEVINSWLNSAGFTVLTFEYQNYRTHTIGNNSEKDFIVCTAQKTNSI